MDDPTLKIQTFRPTWEEFKDFKKYIEYIETQGAHRAGLAKIIPPSEFVPRKQGYTDLTKLKVTIKKPLCQVVANVKDKGHGVYQQVNVPMRSMTITDFKNLANSPKYATPPHRSYAELEQIYWDRMTTHFGIYGADVCGSITDPDYDYWNINRLNTILDYVGKDYDISIDGVNTAYLYFGMWKTTFGWHTEDMDLYSINYLHFGAPKSWYSIPPSYGRKFEKLCAVLFEKSHNICPAFLRHKMTALHPKWLDDYDIPYDRITQEPGEIMITFPYGYHSGFNHGFNCAESTNFTTERWIEYGKHAVLCHCCPDSVKFPMDTFVKRFQPSIYEEWMSGKDKTPHPEYVINPAEITKPPANSSKMSFVERNPDLDLQNILDNVHVSDEIKDELRASYFVSADDELAGMEADYDEREAARKGTVVMKTSISSDEEDDDEENLDRWTRGRNKNNKRKKHDSDYDDDWFEKQSGGKMKKSSAKRGRPAKREKTETKSNGERDPLRTKKSEKTSSKSSSKKQTNVNHSNGTSTVEKDHSQKQSTTAENNSSKSINGARTENGAKSTTVKTESSPKVPSFTPLPPKAVEVSLPQPKKPTIPQVNASRGPSYCDAFTQFLQANTKPKVVDPPSKSAPKVKPTPPPKKEVAQPTSVIQHTAKPVVMQQQQTVVQQQQAVSPRMQQQSLPQSNQQQMTYNLINNVNNETNLAMQQQLLLQQQQQLLQYQLQQQQQQQQQNIYNLMDQNQRVKIEKIPQNLQSQMYSIQENTTVAQDGENQKLYYTILDSTQPAINDTWKMNGQYYGQQQQQSF